MFEFKLRLWRRAPAPRFLTHFSPPTSLTRFSSSLSLKQAIIIIMDMHLFFAGISRRHDKRLDPWYSNLTAQKLKELCRAANVSPTGNKGDLIGRLSRDGLGRFFVWEKSSTHHGLTNAELKTMCSDRKIPKSGSRFDMIKRLLEHNSGGAIKKREANNNKQQPVPKKPRASKTQVLYNKIQKKISSGSTAKKYQSHMGSKTHSEDVYELLSDLLNKAPDDPKKRLEHAKALFTSLTDNFSAIISPGYDMSDFLGGSINELVDIIESVDAEEDTLEWVQNLYDVLSDYSFGDDLKEVIDRLEGGIDDDDDDDTESEDANEPTVSTDEPTKAEDTSTALDMKENQVPNVVSIDAPTKTADTSTVPVMKENQAPNGTNASTKILDLDTTTILDPAMKENQVPNVA